MREEIGDVFTYCKNSDLKIARVIPTNGDRNKDGKAIMGRGVALQAASRFRQIPTILGALTLSQGNHVHEVVLEDEQTFVAFPTKNHWWEAADLKLIERSARELASLTEEKNYDIVAMPRPGVGNGKLNWIKVRKILGSILDNDKYVILTLFDPDDPNDSLESRRRWMT